MIRAKEDILSIIKKNRAEIESFGVKKLGLFGSFARREQGAESDIDLIAEFEEDKKTFDNFIRLGFLLEDLLGRRVELVTVEALSPHIKPYIMKEVEYVTFGS
ncbi:MAG: nucleotidyltransferase family protein [Planctomycetota bacterium]|jgi:predicted nucleotidyltransferase